MGSENLWVIEAKLWNPNVSLKEIKDLWFEAKKIITSFVSPNDGEIEVSINIFNKGIERVGGFFAKFQAGEILPTDEELNLLEEAFNEASWAFDFLAIVSPSICSSENNQGWQEKIKKNKQIVAEEKRKRKQKKKLQAQINFLKSQPNNCDNEAKIKDLERQIEELKKNKPVPTSLPHPDASQPQAPNNNGYLIGIFCLGFGVCLMLVVGCVVSKKKKKKKQVLVSPSNNQIYF